MMLCQASNTLANAPLLLTSSVQADTVQLRTLSHLGQVLASCCALWPNCLWGDSMHSSVAEGIQPSPGANLHFWLLERGNCKWVLLPEREWCCHSIDACLS
jgi:hypothetical protein